MAEKTEHDRMYELLGILQSYAPKGSDQAYCAEIVNNMAANGIPLRAQAAYLAGSIADGLNHGNWPWVIRDVAGSAGDPVADRAYKKAMIEALTPDQIKYRR